MYLSFLKQRKHFGQMMNKKLHKVKMDISCLVNIQQFLCLSVCTGVVKIIIWLLNWLVGTLIKSENFHQNLAKIYRKWGGEKIAPKNARVLCTFSCNKKLNCPWMIMVNTQNVHFFYKILLVKMILKMRTWNTLFWILKNQNMT